jgi:hypothetical protein
MGIQLIPLDAGAHRLADEIQDPAPGSVEVVIGPHPTQGNISLGNLEREFNFGLVVNRANYPFFDSHRISGVPVVPVAMVLEWFLRAAHIYRSDLDIVSCKDLQVLHGISLENFHNGGDPLTLRCRQDSSGDRTLLDMELPGIDHNCYYKARIQMSKSCQDLAQDIACVSPGDLEPWSIDPSSIYKEMLFHGPDFHIIRSLEGVSSNAATAILSSTDQMGWPGGLWETDAAAVDGGLQLAILWGLHISGKKSLPTKIGSYVNYHEGLVNGPIRCELQGRAVRNERTISDLSFFDGEERLVARMCDVEMHMLPDLRPEH